jgi:uncharacterized membrane protein YfcA
MPVDFWISSLLLVSAAFAAGVLNAIAGGGSFLTLPALVFVGIPPIMAIAAAGGMAGALLLVAPAKLFSGIVPWLLLFAFGPALARRAIASSHTGQGLDRWREPGLLITCIYGGYFNGGLGILLMALYAVTGESRIHTANALKNLNSLVLSWLSVAAFVLAGAIAWREGVLMMVAATAGGFMGARWAKRLPTA